MVSGKSCSLYSEKYLLLNLSQCKYCFYLVKPSKYFTSITGFNSYSPGLLGVLFAFFLFFFFLIYAFLLTHKGFPGGTSNKELTCQYKSLRDSMDGKIPRRRA